MNQASIEKLQLANQSLLAEKQVLQSKLEKMRKVTEKVPELQQDNEALRKSKSAFEASKLKLVKDLANMEEDKIKIE